VNNKMLKLIRQAKPVHAALIGLLIVIVLSASLFHHAFADQLNAWKLLPQPERLTELYFTHPNSLPTTYSAGATQTVSFTVHNLEYRTTTYHYVISEQGDSVTTPTTISQGSFTLTQNAYAKPVVNIPLMDDGANAKITVTLAAQNESIDYLVTREGE
jgi:uncharacterized membrane protein